jgi:hypothetical protein
MDPAIDLEQLFGASESQDMVNGRFLQSIQNAKKTSVFSRITVSVDSLATAHPEYTVSTSVAENRT